MDSNKCSHPEPKPLARYKTFPSPQKIPSWCIPANSWPTLKTTVLILFVMCSSCSIWNWPKGTQNLCHKPGNLASSRLSDNNQQFYPKSMHSSLLFASCFLRRVYISKMMKAGATQALPTCPTLPPVWVCTETLHHQVAAMGRHVARQLLFTSFRFTSHPVRSHEVHFVRRKTIIVMNSTYI